MPPRPIKTVQWTAQNRQGPLEADAYLTHHDSRFAATVAPGSIAWTVTHRRSGRSLSNLLPQAARGAPYTLALKVIRAWEGEEFDWSVFDGADPITPAANGDGLAGQLADGMVRRLKELARAAYGPKNIANYRI